MRIRVILVFYEDSGISDSVVYDSLIFDGPAACPLVGGLYELGRLEGGLHPFKLIGLVCLSSPLRGS
jgi:hypothetical protein